VQAPAATGLPPSAVPPRSPQVHEAIGLTFGRVLRGVLRHDPNVILVGEIRDEEAAEIAARAA
jgi:type II secretory ATPase GspE/PulE/Tfp pilus assembly ATPase PilB-like protein